MRQSGSHRAGFTIVELLVVISIIALITGVGLAVMSHSGRQFGFQAVRGELVSLIRYTRSNAAIEKGVSAVVIDPIKKEIYSCARRTVGLWHFEDLDGSSKSSGAFGNNATLQGDAVISPLGRFGHGLLIVSSGSADCGTIPIPSQNAGVSIECWISPTGTGPLSQRTIINLSEGNIMLDADDSVRATYGSLTVNSDPAIIPYERWSHLMMVYEPDYTSYGGSGTLFLYLNNALVGQASGTPSVSIGKKNFTVGTSFTGIIDEVKVALLVETDKLKLEPDVTITNEFGATFPNPFAFRFNKDGRLIQAIVPLLFTSTSTKDSFILEVAADGGVKIR
ncbi:MAG: prepilin-type N-terminal cleavage/methylation domain-containing protein [Planctomycetes bacterium]|nr:prepilin-type N-terminal cleavage/methylation domain-containing protein [Planctomycetota bacterium]